MAHLLLLSPQRRVHALAPTQTLGRDARCDLVLEHPTLSRIHATLFADASDWKLRDEQSRNGTFIDESPLTSGETILRDGQRLRFGRIEALFYTNGVPDHVIDSPRKTSSLAGEEIVCDCGARLWLEGHAYPVRCPRCRRAIGNPTPADSIVASLTDCAACHTPIEPGEPAHRCPHCRAMHHPGCWAENHGCATFGCEGAAHTLSEDQTEVDDAAMRAFDKTLEITPPPPREAMLALLVLAGLLSLPTFGVAALAALPLVWKWASRSKRMLLSGLTLALAAIGAAGSWWWWLT